MIQGKENASRIPPRLKTLTFNLSGGLSERAFTEGKTSKGPTGCGSSYNLSHLPRADERRDVEARAKLLPGIRKKSDSLTSNGPRKRKDTPVTRRAHILRENEINWETRTVGYRGGIARAVTNGATGAAS